ncbi:hypothetical protein GCM10010329_39620 [Streptomyces spiroverticillatus]|uniref:Uncharacterized protein n=1 Tax=Streptomyces finlayi TaxID=67296 RepID=A0A918WZQ5_9ACTN|nr:hypothetical protein GCM10010329_39620 [Streptomyces spiroverticillatus]GHC98275.1 hypothetical protein GCM10010334_40620 [Streptomyces finlayi]
MGVERRGRLDREQHLGVGQQCPYQADALALAAGEAAALGVDRGVEAVAQAAYDVVGDGFPEGPFEVGLRAVVASGDHVAQGSGEEVGLLVGDQDAGANLFRREGVEPGAAPGGVGRGEPAEAFDHVGGVRRPGGDQRGQLPGPYRHARRRVVQDRGLLRRVRALRRVGLQVQETEQPPGGDQSAAEVGAALDEERHRDRQHRHIPVHSDQLAHRQGAFGGHPGGEPGDHGEEQHRQSRPEGADPAGDGGDPVALFLQHVRVAAVAGGVHLLAAEPGQHPQSPDDVPEPGRESTLLLPVRGLYPLEAAQQRPEHERDQRYADQDENGELPGDGEQESGDDQAGDRRADPGTGDGQHVRHRGGVAEPDGDHLSRTHPAGQRGPEPGGVGDDEAGRAEDGVEPDPGHGAVPNDREVRVERPDTEQRRAPQREPAPRRPE